MSGRILVTDPKVWPLCFCPSHMYESDTLWMISEKRLSQALLSLLDPIAIRTVELDEGPSLQSPFQDETCTPCMDMNVTPQ